MLGEMRKEKQNAQRMVRNTKGAALIFFVLFVTFTSIVVILGITGTLIREFKSAENMLVSSEVYYAAESGSEDAYYRLKEELSYSGTQTLILGEATATTTITNIGAGNWEIVVQADKELLIRKIQTDISTTVTNADFPYGAQVGEGGIVMDNVSEIKGDSGAGCDVFSNGSVIGSLGATVTGNITISTGISEDAAERSVVCVADQILAQANPEIDFAQSFVASNTLQLAKISLYLKKNENPGDETIRIVADIAGSPNTVTLAQGTLSSSLVGTTYAWIDVVFPTPATLTAGNTYWIVFDDAGPHASRHYTWCNDTAAGYANGEIQYSEDWDDGSWAGVVGDLAFRLFWGEGFSEVKEVDVSGIVKANTITNSTIGGDAYYQTISGSTVGGTSYPGSADPPVVPMPLSDANITSWRTAAEAGSVISGNCPDDPACSLNMGPVKIDGNLTVSINDTFTITGIVYVTGDFYPENNTAIVCDVSFGDQSCILLVDGNIDVSNNAAFSGSGDPDSFLLALSTVEDCNGGTQETWCGPENSAIYVANNATGVIFYATNSKIHLNNGVNVTTVVGHKLHLANGAIITYDTDVSDLNFSSGPDGGWVVNDWEEVE